MTKTTIRIKIPILRICILGLVMSTNFTQNWKEHCTLQERRERGDLITIYRLMNNQEKTDRKDLILRIKGEVGNLDTRKNCKKEFA